MNVYRSVVKFSPRTILPISILIVLLFGLPLVVLTAKFQGDATRLIVYPAKFLFWGGSVAVALLFYLFEKEKLKLTSVHFLALTLWTWMLASMFWSVNTHESIESFFHWSLLFASLFLFSFYIRTQSAVKSCLWACMISIGIAMSISLLQHYTTFLRVYFLGGFPEASTFGNYKFMSHFGLIMLPLFIPLFLWAKSHLERGILGVLLVINISHFYMTGYNAKAVWIGLFANMAIVIIFAVRNIPHFKKGLATLCMIAAILFGLGAHYSYESISPERALSTIQQRWIMWRTTLRSNKDYKLFGSGVGTFPVVYPKYETPTDRKFYPEDQKQGWVFFTRQSHNEVLQLFLELGIIGGLLFCLFLLVILFKAVRRLFTCHDGQRFYLLALLLSYVNLLLLSVIYFPFQQPMSALLFCLVAGLLIRETARERTTPSPSGLKQLFVQTSSGLVVTTLVIFVLISTTRYFLSDWYWEKARIHKDKPEAYITQSMRWDKHDWEKLWSVGLFHLNSKQYNRAEEYFLKAHELSPYMPHMPYNLGLVYRNLNRESQALVQFNKALKIAPDYIIAHHQMGLIFYDRGRLKKAFSFFKRAQAKWHPLSHHSFYMAALCQARLKHYEMARKEIIEALAFHPREMLYHQVLSFLDSKPRRFIMRHRSEANTSLIRQELQSNNDAAVVNALQEAQITRGAEVLIDDVMPYLSHRNLLIRKEATAYFHGLPADALTSLMPYYEDSDNDEMKWRLFYVLSERLPFTMAKAADDIYNDPSILNGDYDKIIYPLSIRHTAKLAPYKLVTGSLIDSNYHPIIQFYSYN